MNISSRTRSRSREGSLSWPHFDKIVDLTAENGDESDSSMSSACPVEGARGIGCQESSLGDQVDQSPLPGCAATGSDGCDYDAADSELSHQFGNSSKTAHHIVCSGTDSSKTSRHLVGSDTDSAKTAHHIVCSDIDSTKTSRHIVCSDRDSTKTAHHIVGSDTKSSKTSRHLVGSDTDSTKTNRHIVGSGTDSTKTNRHIVGSGTDSTKTSSHIVGNSTDSTTSRHIVGSDIDSTKSSRHIVCSNTDSTKTAHHIIGSDTDWSKTSRHIVCSSTDSTKTSGHIACSGTDSTKTSFHTACSDNEESVLSSSRELKVSLHRLPDGANMLNYKTLLKDSTSTHVDNSSTEQLSQRSAKNQTSTEIYNDQTVTNSNCFSDDRNDFSNSENSKAKRNFRKMDVDSKQDNNASKKGRHKLKKKSSGHKADLKGNLDKKFVNFFDTILNQTSDFSGGCSQFEMVAKKVVKKNATKKLGKKKTERKAVYVSRVVPDVKCVIVTSEQNDVHSNICDTVNSEPGLADRGGTVRMCQSCGDNIIEEDFTAHVKLCLRSRFQRKAPAKKSAALPSASSSRPKIPSHVCNVCGQDLGRYSVTDREKHCTRCFHSHNTKDQRETIALSSRVDSKSRSGAYTLCSICQKDISHFKLTDREHHLDSCTGSRDHNDDVRGLSEINLQVTVSCHICHLDITDQPTQDREKHIQSCVKSRDLLSDPEVHFDDVAGAKEKTDRVVCHVCQKDLSHLSKTRQDRHLNCCCDKDVALQKEKEKERANIEKARDKVLPCPICGQPLKTFPARKSHLKKCAAEFNITTKHLINLDKKQQEEYQLKLDAGILPEKSPVKPKRNAGGRRPGRSRQDRGRHSKEDLQLAVALSASMQEEEQRRRESLADFAGIPPQITTSAALTPAQNTEVKDAFSMLMSSKPEKAPVKKSKSKRKIRDDHVPTLLLRSSQERKSKLAEKVTSIILPQNDPDVVKTPTLPRSKLSRIRGLVAKSNAESEQKEPTLWEKCAHAGIEPARHESVFYVADLTSVIPPDTVAAGSKLKKMSNIAGWQPLSQENSEKLNTTTVVTPGDTSQLGNQTIAPTQTALMLAELASSDTTIAPPTEHDQTLAATPGNNDDSILHTSNHDMSCLHNSGDNLNTTSVAERSGFCIFPQEEQMACEATGKLKAGLEGMVNSPLLSDIQLSVKDGEILFAHKFILAARCPQLFKAAQTVKEISLQAFSKDCCLAVLRYLYTGDVDISETLVFTVKKLATRLELKELELACKNRIETNELHDADSQEESDRVSQRQNFDQTLQNILREAWGSDSDDEDEDDDGDDSDTDNADKAAEKTEMEDDEREMRELYEYTASQRKAASVKINKSSESDSSDSECQENQPTKNQEEHASFDDCDYQAGQDAGDLIKNSPPVKLHQLSDEEILERLSSQDDIPDFLSQALLDHLEQSFSSSQPTRDQDQASSSENETGQVSGMTCRVDDDGESMEEAVDDGVDIRGISQRTKANISRNNLRGSDNESVQRGTSPRRCSSQDRIGIFYIDFKKNITAIEENDLSTNDKTAKIPWSPIQLDKTMNSRQDDCASEPSLSDQNTNHVTQLSKRIVKSSEIRRPVVKSITDLRSPVTKEDDGGNVGDGTPDLFSDSPPQTGHVGKSVITERSVTSNPPEKDKSKAISNRVDSLDGDLVANADLSGLPLATENEDNTCAELNDSGCNLFDSLNASVELLDSSDQPQETETLKHTKPLFSNPLHSPAADSPPTACATPKSTGLVKAKKVHANLFSDDNVEKEECAFRGDCSFLDDSRQVQHGGSSKQGGTKRKFDADLASAPTEHKADPVCPSKQETLSQQHLSTVQCSDQHIAPFKSPPPTQPDSQNTTISPAGQKVKRRRVVRAATRNPKGSSGSYSMTPKSSTEDNSFRESLCTNENTIDLTTDSDVQILSCKNLHDMDTTAHACTDLNENPCGKSAEVSTCSEDNVESNVARNVCDAGDIMVVLKRVDSPDTAHTGRHAVSVDAGAEERSMGDNSSGGELMLKSMVTLGPEDLNSSTHTETDEPGTLVLTLRDGATGRRQAGTDHNMSLSNSQRGYSLHDDTASANETAGSPSGDANTTSLGLQSPSGYADTTSEAMQSPPDYTDDVWDDFYDGGFTGNMDYDTPTQQTPPSRTVSSRLHPGSSPTENRAESSDLRYDSKPAQSSKSNISPVKKSTIVLNEDRTPTRIGANPPEEAALAGYSPPTDVDDSSVADTSILWAEEETEPEPLPQPQPDTKASKKNDKRPKKAKKTWVPPSPFTPQPDYAAMATPQLKNACQKFGARPMPKKKMRTFLKNVYDETHQLETDSEFESSLLESGSDTQTASRQGTAPTVHRQAATTALPRQSDTSSKASKTKKLCPSEKQKQQESGSSSDILHTSFTDSELDTSDDRQVILEESILPETEGDAVKLSKRDTAYKRQQIRKFIESNEELYLTTLHYVPLEFGVFHQQLKDGGISVGVTVLQDFLDEQNVQFTMRSVQKSGKGKRAVKSRKAAKSLQNTGTIAAHSKRSKSKKT